MKLGNSTNLGTVLFKLMHQFEKNVLCRDDALYLFLDDAQVAIARENHALLNQPPQTEAEQFLRLVYWYVILRERHGDDVITQAIQQGCQQLVLLGAGYDTRFFKLPEIQAHSIPTFEVDLPQTIVHKTALLQQNLGYIPDQLHLVSLDFNQADLNDLIHAGVNPDLPTIYIWQGVSYYLPQKSVAIVVEFVRSHLSPGSMFVFDACTPLMTFTNDQIPGIAFNIDQLNQIGEPYQFGLYPDEMKAWLYEKGFETVEILNQTDLEQRYLQRQTLPSNMWYVVICT
jgi:methyltransferase (TIGR00027 family)